MYFYPQELGQKNAAFAFIDALPNSFEILPVAEFAIDPPPGVNRSAAFPMLPRGISPTLA
jgi:hypothetical protein